MGKTIETGHGGADHPDGHSDAYRQVSLGVRAVAFLVGFLWSGAVCWALIRAASPAAASGIDGLRFLLTLTAGATAVLAGQPLLSHVARRSAYRHLAPLLESSYLSGAGSSALAVLLVLAA